MSDEIIVKYRGAIDGTYKVPTYATPGSAGCDLYSSNTIYLQPGSWLLVGTGLYLEIPIGYEAQVRPRSGLAANRGITVLNSPGTIDSDYRGEVKVCLVNLGKEIQVIEKGDRIAQLVFSKVYQATFEKVTCVSVTERGDGGFGSTGGLFSLVVFIEYFFCSAVV